METEFESRMQALTDLLAKVEAGEIVQAIDARALWPEIRIWGEVCRASQASLDAAKALHEAVLPGWDAQVHLMDRGAEVFDGHMFAGFTLRFSAHSEDPARAWLIAILRALIAEDDGE